jgi:hypothetical protein
MEEYVEKNYQELDNELAAFVDQLLDQTSGDKAVFGLASDLEVRKLQEAVLMLNNSLKANQPDPVLSQRIRKNLVKNWTGPISQNNSSFWARLRRRPLPEQPAWHSTGNARRTQALRLVFATITILVLVAIFMPKIGTALTGTAINTDSLLPILLVAGVILVAAILWFANRGK